MPTDRLTIRSTIFDNNAKENIAAAEMLNTPAMAVVKRMESSVELILSLGTVQQAFELEHTANDSANGLRGRSAWRLPILVSKIGGT